ncbi:proline/betaine ABC transporter permease ProW, partial [Serratia marcescens]
MSDTTQTQDPWATAPADTGAAPANDAAANAGDAWSSAPP